MFQCEELSAIDNTSRLGSGQAAPKNITTMEATAKVSKPTSAKKRLSHGTKEKIQDQKAVHQIGKKCKWSDNENFPKKDLNGLKNDSSLFVLHNGILKPILSDMKSGIYRLLGKEYTPIPTDSQENVYVTDAKHGTVLPASAFERLRKIQIEKTASKDATNTPMKKRPKCNKAVKRPTYRIVVPGDLNLEGIQILNPPIETEGLSIRTNSPRSDVIVISKPTRGRPKKNQRTITTKEEISIEHKQNAVARTRCGRLSRPPKHVGIVLNRSTNDNDLVQTFNKERQTDKFNNERQTEVTSQMIENSGTEVVKRERNIPSDYQCRICNKIVLGKVRMMKHLESCKEKLQKDDSHNSMNSNTSLYEYFTQKILQDSASEDEKVEKFLNELTDFIGHLQARSSNIIQDTSKLYFINSKIANIFGVHEGHFGINIDAINMPVNVRENIAEEINLIPPPPPRLDYNLSISLDNSIIQDPKLQLPDNVITSDESLLRTVDDLVKEKMKGLNTDDGLLNVVEPSTTVMHYDHVNDNAVEASTIKENQHPPLLELSLDLFQFNSN